MLEARLRLQASRHLGRHQHFGPSANPGQARVRKSAPTQKSRQFLFVYHALIYGHARAEFVIEISSFDMAEEQANKPHRKAKDSKKNNPRADGSPPQRAAQRLTFVQERIQRLSPSQSQENCKRELPMLTMYAWLRRVDVFM
jgi:hypothetical protein